MISVVVCDDHGIIRSGIRRILETTTDFHLVASAPTGELLLQAVRDFAPELVVLDIRLTDCNGLDLLEQISAISPETRVVMLSMYGAKGYVEKAKTRGARGYITKECLDEELVSVLYAVMKDEGFVSFRADTTEPGGPESLLEANIDSLSSRELDVLKMIASGLTNTEIAEELTVSPRTVESHRASIQRKLLIRTRAELARVARDAGLLD
ncbi:MULTISPECIES: response regulator [Rhodococcus]|uniref:Response regulator, two-component system n=1 Tax=Rhodococcus jostii (strain RHA1) TaxID=101510 RepID=Q0RWM2_RHOJR|nr:MULTISPECIES: response regulator transcription factor [Rhodococcus]AAR90120.1 response regulator [Rhodococcus sp. DK17]ABH00314.1 response regulator, two-component system [Rhodococcus jostii RHA1]